MKKNTFLPLLFLFITIIFFFHSFLSSGKLPIPSDTIIGLYHPFRDLYAKEYPNGIAYKNFLITDPVRQQYPWRFLAVSLEKSGLLPLWNPYSFGGTPLLANFQTAAFYPLNILLFLLPFQIGWSILVMLQPLLAGLFLYLYLRRMRLSELAAAFGGVIFAFCGFSIAWLEWNLLGQVALWLPLILLAKEHLLAKTSYKWIIVLIFAECSAFLAGHLQTFFYLALISESYLIARVIQIIHGEKQKTHFWKKAWGKYYQFLIYSLIIIVVTFIQWLPTVQFVLQSARDTDQLDAWKQAGWFIPWQNLVQFFSPDFFGNPTTLNYWGVWNYGEFVGYIGLFPLIISLFALFYRRDGKTFFFGILFFLSLLFSLPTIFAQAPYLLHIPFLSTSQPTRLLFITDFSLSVLSALGLDFYLKNSNKIKILYPLAFVFVIFAGLWIFVLAGYKSLHIDYSSIVVSKHNLYLPTGLLIAITVFLLAYIFIKQPKIRMSLIIVLLLISVVDLFRFADKFIPFTNQSYLFPPTAALSYLQSQKGQFRIMETDSQIMPPNFSIMYHLQSLDGYDPLYLERYGEFIAAIQRNRPDISPPFGFNRIITPKTIDSRLIDLFGVKYIMSLSDLKDKKLTKVFTEGQTRIYKNSQAFPRVFFAQNVKVASDKNEAIKDLFNSQVNLHTTAIVENWDKENMKYSTGTATITKYSENSITISTQNNDNSFLVLTDSFYPTWHVTIDGKENKIYRTDYTFRGVLIPSGKHRVVFYDSLL